MAKRYESVVARGGILTSIETFPESTLPAGATGAALVDEDHDAFSETGWRVGKIRRLESVDDRITVAVDPTRHAVTLRVQSMEPEFRNVIDVEAVREGATFVFLVDRQHINRFVVLLAPDGGTANDAYECRIMDHADPAESAVHIPHNSEIEVFSLCLAPVTLVHSDDGGATWGTANLIARGGLHHLENHGALVIKKYGAHRCLIIGALL